MWNKLTIESKNIIDEYTKNRFEICDYSFVNLFLWSFGEKTEYKIEDEVLIIKSIYKNQVYYYMPIPKYDTEKCIKSMKEKIYDIGKEKGIILYIPEEWKVKLNEAFKLKETRYLYDYLYTVEKLAFLKGRNYSKKKNRINNFLKNYNYVYEKISKENINEVIEFQKKWYSLHKIEDEGILKNELEGIIELLKNFEYLNLKGGLIKVSGNIVAYTLAEELNSKTIVIHIEKALIEYTGAYQAINSFFLKEECLNYEFVNREDDFGDDGLREAKLSYHPIKLLEKYSISWED